LEPAVKLIALLPFLSAFVTLIFAVLVLRRFFVVKGGRRSYHLLFWGIGLLFYFTGSLTEAMHTALGWRDPVYRVWYLAGAILVAAWLGQGTVELLVRRRIRGVRISHILLVVLVMGSLWAAYRVMTAQIEPIMISGRVSHVESAAGFTDEEVITLAASALEGPALEDDGTVSTGDLSPLAQAVLAEAEAEGLAVPLPRDVSAATMPQISAMAGDRRVDLQAQGDRLLVSIDGQPAGALTMEIASEMRGHAIVSPGVRVLTPFFNMYGTLGLVGGAIYSAAIFFRKQIMPNRVTGNVLIAAGAMLPATGGLLSRFGLEGYLYVSELVGAILIFAGFIVATTRPEAQTAQAASQPAKGR
jgi:hypothetical protein